MGLLDSFGKGFGSPESAAWQSVANGLLSGNFGAGITGANAAYTNAQRGLLDTEIGKMKLEDYKSEIEARKVKMAREQAAMEQAARMRAGIPGLFTQPGMTGGEPQPQTMGGVPMFSQPMGAGPMQSTPGGFDVQAAIRLGMDPEMIQKYAGLGNIGRPKATRQMEVDDGQGGKRIALVDDFGKEVAGFAGYTAPVQVDTGKGTSFVKPMAGLNVAKVPTFGDDTARRGQDMSYSTAIRGQNMNDARAREANSAGKVPAGYRLKMDGSMEAIPGGPADQKAGAEGQKKVSEAKDVLGLLDEVDKLLPNATGSYIGAGVDHAARMFGSATPGAVATAQLKTIQGALIGKMPKMSGPQSDKDVQLYRESAGQVADPTLPVQTRQAASATIRRLNEKYAGMPEGSSKPQAKPGKTVKRTGTYGGKKVVQYSDGSTEYAD